MPRIIKAGAATYQRREPLPNREHIPETVPMYLESDTVEIKQEWRPEGYKNPHPQYLCGNNGEKYPNRDYEIYEQSFDACLEALEKVK